ncbi:matrixin family metalloprotease [Chloroflexota bacterium]
MSRLLIASLIILTLVLGSMGVVAASPPADKPGNGPPELEKVVFIHYDKGAKPDHPIKPDKPGKPGGDENPEDQYKLSKLILGDTMAYYINPSAISGAVGAINTSFDIWDSVTQQDIFAYGGPTNKSGANQDYQNTVSWAPLSDQNIIAQATMWYVPGKPPRAIIEYDIVFNSLLPWGIDPDGEGPEMISAYDIQNIATHEVGHPVGLADIYEDQCNVLTMYGYSGLGETQKRSLESGDIKGAQSLYGP